MADPPFISDEPQQGAPLNAVASAFKWARDQIPQNPDAGISLANMARGGLESMGRWAQGVTDPSAITPSAIAAPAGAAAMTAPFVAAARGMSPTTLHGFIGPAAAARLDLTPGSRGSLGALERAQQTWAKGGTDPGALAETWAKHGWAPPESFGAGTQPFSWLEMPELRIKDSHMDQIQERLAKGDRTRLTGSARHLIEPNADGKRLMTAEPQLLDASIDLAIGPKTPWQGYATTHGRWPDDPPEKGPRPMVGMQGKDVRKAESGLLGHELRGHALPGLSGAQDFTPKAEMMPLYLTRAGIKLDDDLRRSQIAAGHAAYFADPAERMARHAQDLHIRERQGQSPFKEAHAPGVMSTYGDRAFVDQQMLNEALGLGGGFRLRDFAPMSPDMYYKQKYERAPFTEAAE